ncbi:uncharacterized protein LOC115230903 [Octopus sinensis]|uniref:Uncharacterized protein LOC115230903 n=1 Tax=Octopus sinensis TaxID=2607531 RepID=A0A6P7U3L9_9MOLL|nr:uncharacterized protein LOC115230903 [Octopus sinensis]
MVICVGARWILHLPDTTSYFLYSSRCDSRLRLHQMVRLIPKCIIRCNLRLLMSRYAFVKKIADSAGLAEQNQQLVASFNLLMLPNTTLISGWCTPIDGQAQLVHRACVAAFCGDVVGNSWISRLGGITEKCFLSLLKMRSNIFPTRETMIRGSRGVFMRPKCRVGVETISHISRVCGALKGPRLARHNKICNLVAKEAAAYGWSISVEPSYIV